MSNPIIILCGEAGSGKDSVGAILRERHGAVTVAQADPMKRFCRVAFAFSDEQLWGPSERRNAPDERYRDLLGDAWKGAEEVVKWRNASWLKEIFGSGPVSDDANFALRAWFERLFADHADGSRVLTPRYVLQTLGTEFGRSIDPGVWSKYAAKTAVKLLSGGCGYTPIDGVRESPGAAPPALAAITDGRFPNEVLNVKAVGGTAWKVWDPTAAVREVKGGKAGHASEALLRQIPESWYDAVVENPKNGLDRLATTVAQAVRSLYPSRPPTFRSGK